MQCGSVANAPLHNRVRLLCVKVEEFTADLPLADRAMEFMFRKAHGCSWTQFLMTGVVPREMTRPFAAVRAASCQSRFISCAKYAHVSRVHFRPPKEDTGMRLTDGTGGLLSPPSHDLHGREAVVCSQYVSVHRAMMHSSWRHSFPSSSQRRAWRAYAVLAPNLF